MKQILLATAICLTLSLPVAAENEDLPTEPLIPDGTLSDLLNWLSDDGERLFQDFLTELGPQLEALREQVQDWTLYETPEVLENGDIIIRRKPRIDDEALPEGTREI